MKNKNVIVYQITIQDIQEVAAQELNRELSEEELRKLIDPIGNKIPWYEAIANSINDMIFENEQ